MHLLKLPKKRGVIKSQVHRESYPQKGYFYTPNSWSIPPIKQNNARYPQFPATPPPRSGPPPSATHLASDFPYEAMEWPFLLKLIADLVQKPAHKPWDTEYGSGKVGCGEEKRRISEEEEDSKGRDSVSLTHTYTYRLK